MRTLAAKLLAATVRAFLTDRSGNFAILFGLSSVMLVTAAGMALDYSRLSSAKVRLTQAVDAAVLSTTRNITLGNIGEDDASEVVRAYVFANIDEGEFPGDPVKIDKVVVDTNAKTLEVEASIRVPMTLTKLLGSDDRTISTGAKAQFSNTRIEVAMALDITGSMGSKIAGTSTTRIQALKSAASQGVEKLLSANQAIERVRIGLVPYARSVDAAPVIDRIETTEPTAGCVIERTGSQAHTDAFASPVHPVGAVVDPAPHCPRSEILPMTANEEALLDHIDDLSTDGWTAGHVAVAWTQYMLSSSWNAAWPAASDVAPDGTPNTRKVAIIMTDGQFNTFDSSSHKPNSARAKQLSRQTALSICSEMKDRNITVYTIAFIANSNSGAANAIDLMRDCATPDSAQVIGSCSAMDEEDRSFFFRATDQRELEDAFIAIASDITCVRLTG